MATLLAILGRPQHGCEKADFSEDVICSSDTEQTFRGSLFRDFGKNRLSAEIGIASA